MVTRSASTWLLGALLLAALVAGACGDGPRPGVLVQLQAPAEPQARPEWLWIYWLGSRGLLLEARLPEHGSLPGTGSRLASLFVETAGALAEARVLAVRGQRGDRIACGGMLRIEPGPDPRPSLELQLGPPLPDADGDGVPDLVEAACGRDGGACPRPQDGAPADGAGDRPADPSWDGPPAADAGAEPDDAAATGDAPGPTPDRPGAPPDAAPDAPDPDPTAALRVDLVAHWRLDEGSGAVAYDSSGHNNVAMLLGAAASAWTTGGRVGGALDLPPDDGTGGLVLPTTSVAAIDRGLTVAAWTFRSSNRGGARLSTVLSRRAASSPDRDYFALAFTGDGRARGSINAHFVPAPPVVQSPAPIPLDRWVHVAFTYDGASMRLYVDGAPAGTAAYAGSVDSAVTPLCLGCAHNRPGYVDVDEALAGRLDELLLYARALPAQEIARLAAGEVPAPR